VCGGGAVLGGAVLGARAEGPAKRRWDRGIVGKLGSFVVHSHPE
jgi:hypothetical protein